MNFAISTSLPSSQRSHEMLSLDFQNNITQGSTILVKKNLSEGAALNRPLPNLEMPLHLAVRENKKDLVIELLEQGADPEIKDFQNLSAIDHAFLMNNEDILANILGKKIETDVKNIKEIIKCKGSVSHINQIKSKMQKIANVNVQNLSLVHKNAYQGNIEDLVENLSIETIDQFDRHGFTPIHYAILGNQHEIINFLIRCGVNINAVTRDGDSLLHFAAITGSHKIFQILISAGADVNHRNCMGETPLHYASAQEQLSVVNALIKEGANPSILDNQKMSPLALIGANALRKDPLSLSSAHIALFTVSSLFWIHQMALISGWVGSNQFPLTTQLGWLGVTITACAEMSILMSNVDTMWKQNVARIGWLGASVIPQLQVPLAAWNTYHVVHSALDELKNCWNNLGYRNWAVARNIVIYSVNSVSSLYRFHQLYRGEKPTVASGDDKKCASVFPARFGDLTTAERLLHQELDPSCPEHALHMISPTFTMAQLENQGADLYTRTYHKLCLEFHPDKSPMDNASQVIMRLNMAYDTLKKWSHSSV